jgi:hypothetical protein
MAATEFKLRTSPKPEFALESDTHKAAALDALREIRLPC